MRLPQASKESLLPSGIPSAGSFVRTPPPAGAALSRALLGAARRTGIIGRIHAPGRAPPVGRAAILLEWRATARAAPLIGEQLLEGRRRVALPSAGLTDEPSP